MLPRNSGKSLLQEPLLSRFAEILYDVHKMHVVTLFPGIFLLFSSKKLITNLLKKTFFNSKNKLSQTIVVNSAK